MLCVTTYAEEPELQGLIVTGKTTIKSESIDDVCIRYDRLGKTYYIVITLNKDGIDQLSKIMKNNAGKEMALFFDDMVLSKPVHITGDSISEIVVPTKDGQAALSILKRFSK